MRTRSNLYLLNTFLSSPEEVLFTFLIFIVSKSLGATPFQLLVMACLKPITSLFAFYVSAWLSERSHSIRSYLILNSLIGTLPCLAFPFVDNVWFYVASYGLFSITRRAVYPAWIEVLKCSYDIPKMSTIISRGTSIKFAITIFFPPLVSLWFDFDPNLWKWVFIATACLKMISTLLIMGIKVETPLIEKKSTANLYQLFCEPFVKGWKVLREKPPFAHYLAMFFLGGAGLIGIHSILPIFFKEELHLSYTTIALAFSGCKGIAFIMTSPIWAKTVNRYSLYTINCYMNFFSCVFLGLVLASNFGAFWLFPAYISYGVMQSGAKLSKNLSGAIFAENDESTFLSSMNLAMVGVRGTICPTLGYLLFSISNANVVFIAALFLCFLGIPYGLWLNQRYSNKLVYN